MNVPVCLTVPKRPPCAGVEQDKVVDVYVLMNPGGHRAMYLRIDCIDWLLAYGADEHYYQGITRTPPPEQAAVADLPYTISWDFGTDAWKAEILSGGARGATHLFKPEKLDKIQWNYLLADPSAVQWFTAHDTRFS